MIIERLDLIAFGQFTNVTLDLSAGPNRFHIVYGPNESGKSTSMRAIHSLLFGMPQRSDDNFIHAYPAMRVGGKFRDAASGDVIQCVRRRGKSKTLVSPDESEEVDPSRLAALLRGVDSETFSRQFGLSHHELVSGGRAILEGAGDLGEMLFAAGTGTGTLRTARAQLEKDRRELFIERGSSGTINKLIARYAETEKLLREVRLLPLQYDNKHKELDRAIVEASNLEQQLKAQTQARRLLTAYNDAQKLLPERESILAQLESPIGSTPLLDNDFITSRRNLETKWQASSQQLKTYRDQISELVQSRDRLIVDDQWIALAPTIKALMNELGQVQSGRKQIDHYQRELTGTDQQITTAIEKLQQTAIANRDTANAETTIESLAIPESVRNEIDAMVTRYGGLVEGLQSTEDNVIMLRQTQEQVASQLERMPAAADVKPLADALADVGKPRLLLDAVAKCVMEEDKARRVVVDSLASLRGFSGTVEDVRKLLPPAESKIAELAAAILDTKSELNQRQTALVNARQKLKEAEAILNEFVCDSDLPTTDQQIEARRKRDATVAQLRSLANARQSIDENLVETLKEQIRRADEITDTLHRAYDQVLRRQRFASDVAVAKKQVDSEAELVATAAEAFDTALSRWNTLWETHGILPGTPDEMRQWVSDLAKLKESITHWDDKKSALTAVQSSVDRAVDQLLTAVRIVERGSQLSQSSPCGPELNDAYTYALMLKDTATGQQQARVECEAELKRAEAALKKAINEQKKQQRDWERWKAHWQELVTQIAVSPSARPENIYSILRQIDEIQSLRQTRDSIVSSLQTIQQNEREYLKRVEATARLVQFDFQPEQFGECVEGLSRQLDEYQKRENERQLLSQHVQTLEQKIQAASDDEQSLLAQLKSLCLEARAEDISQLPAIEQASAKRRELEKDLKTIDQQLRLLAATDPLEDFIQRASQQDPAVFEIELSKCETELERLHQRWAAAQQTVGKLRGEVEQMDASDQAAVIQQERQNLLAAMRRHASRYAELTIAEDALKRAIDHYRENNEGPVLRRASVFFNRLTDGEYDGLQIDFDEKDQPKLVGIRPDAKSTVVANLMSDGTADALYLSLRLASLEVHLDTHHPVPLIVDDCLVQFDDDRACAALKILSEISCRTQVILFTHHQHLLELARDNLPSGGFHAHQLDKRFVSVSPERN